MARDHRPIGEDASIELKKERAMELRVAGLSYNQIAREMGISKGCAFNYVAAVLEETKDSVAELADQARIIELQRIDEASKLCMQTLAETEWDDRVGGTEEHPGDPTKGRELRLKAVDRLVKLNDQRAKLLGLYAPAEVNANFTEKVSPQQIRESLRRRFGGAAAPEVNEDADPGDSSDGE